MDRHTKLPEGKAKTEAQEPKSKAAQKAPKAQNHKKPKNQNAHTHPPVRRQVHPTARSSYSSRSKINTIRFTP
jgi:hypothetical protein